MKFGTKFSNNMGHIFKYIGAQGNMRKFHRYIPNIVMEKPEVYKVLDSDIKWLLKMGYWEPV